MEFEETQRIYSTICLMPGIDFLVELVIASKSMMNSMIFGALLENIHHQDLDKKLPGRRMPFSLTSTFSMTF